MTKETNSQAAGGEEVNQDKMKSQLISPPSKPSVVNHKRQDVWSYNSILQALAFLIKMSRSKE